jgi:hypothetical protein
MEPHWLRGVRDGHGHVPGPSTVITQGSVFIIGVALLLLSRKAVARGWLA